MKPPTRQRAPRKQFDTGFNRKWTLKEKENLVQGIKRFGADNFTQLQTCVQNRSVKEVEEFISKRRRAIKFKPCHSDFPSKTPIEDWIELAHDLLFQSDDLSVVVGNVRQTAERFEQETTGVQFNCPHETVSEDSSTSYTLDLIMEMSQKLGKHQTSSDIDRPCYQKLYQYIAAVLLGKEVPKLTQIEASVMLELFQHLADRLNLLNLVDQRRLMQLKFSLLRRTTDPLKPLNTRHLISIGIQDDPLLKEREMNEKKQSQASHTSDDEECDQDVTQKKYTDSPSTSQLGTSSTTSNQVQKSCEEPKKNLWPKQTPLFSVNPFNIPVKYLNPHPVQPLEPTWPQSKR